MPGAPERDGTLRTAGPSRRDASVLAAACAAFELVGDLAESVAEVGDDGLQTMGPGLKRLLDAETHECRVDVTLELHLELEQARSPMDWPCEVG